MSDATLTIRTDSSTKKIISDFASSLGLSTSAFITVVTLQAVREGSLTLTPELQPTPYLVNIMSEIEEDLKHNRNIIHTNSKQEALAHLKSLM